MLLCRNCGANIINRPDLDGDVSCYACGRPVIAPPAASAPKRCFRGHLLTPEYWFCQVCRPGARCRLHLPVFVDLADLREWLGL